MTNIGKVADWRRWSAFTDDELRIMLSGGLCDTWVSVRESPVVSAWLQEIRAETEQRKADALAEHYAKYDAQREEQYGHA